MSVRVCMYGTQHAFCMKTCTCFVGVSVCRFAPVAPADEETENQLVLAELQQLPNGRSKRGSGVTFVIFSPRQSVQHFCVSLYGRMFTVFLCFCVCALPAILQHCQPSLHLPANDTGIVWWNCRKSYCSAGPVIGTTSRYCCFEFAVSVDYF